MKISAVITTHNRCNDLINAINSVKEQTYPIFEIIIVDDASTDETEIVCKKIEGIKYVRIEKKDSKGGNHARNIGISESHGDYIAFLDDDDIWYSDKTQKQVELIEQNSGIGMVYSGIHTDVGIRYLNYDVTADSNIQGDIVKKKAYWRPICVTSTMVIKRAILIEMGGFDEKLRYWQEYELTLRIIQKCLIGVICEPLINYSRKMDRKKITNNYDGWKESVNYILEKHKFLFAKLGEKEQELFKETYYKEAGFRLSACDYKDEMKKCYKKAYYLTRKIEYLIRWKLGISRQNTFALESVIRKVKNKKLLLRSIINHYNEEKRC